MGDLKREDGVLIRANRVLGTIDVERRAHEIDGEITMVVWERDAPVHDWMERSAHRIIGTRAELAALAKAFPVEPDRG